jgi:very-short-patch-repair endonuclease
MIVKTMTPNKPNSFSLREKARLRGNANVLPNSTMTTLAKNLRTNQTDAELKLWTALRSRQIQGAKFRRQFPVSNYIVDFVCFEEKLVIEVDGSQHAQSIESDAIRTAYLESEGLSVIRFTNHDVLKNLEGVVFRIIEKLASQREHSPSPKPSP